jgi:hypothetical protein
MPIADDPAPQPPLEPDAADCCGEGCVNCIFDVYDAALERYRRDLAAWQARQREREVQQRSQADRSKEG